MFFLLRVAFWLSLVILLIPADPSDTAATKGRNVSTLEAIGAAQTAFDDAKGFCGRNPSACDVGRSALDGFGAKARTGARWVYDQLDGKDTAPATTASTPRASHRTGERDATAQPRRPVS